jgi:hypothetical protein
VSAKNPRGALIHRIATPSYQGRSAWPAFNVEFADRLLDLSTSAEARYVEEARPIIGAIGDLIERHGGYLELISLAGPPYSTWAYLSAVAHSWLPRFVSVLHRAFP